jgi:hypothetical protein
MTRRIRRNPVEARTTDEPLFRSVSPEEMIDIARTGLITGRGNAFSGDTRRDLVFFGSVDAGDVLYNGEDTLRAVQSSEKFVEAWKEMWREEEDLNRLMARFDRYKDSWVPRAEEKEFNRLRRAQDARHKRESKLRNSMYDAAEKLRAKHKKKYGATSFTLELHGLPSGTVYSKPDSFHQSNEVGFPRDPGVSSAFIEWVYVVLDGEIVKKLPYEKFLRMFLEKK